MIDVNHSANDESYGELVAAHEAVEISHSAPFQKNAPFIVYILIFVFGLWLF